MINKLFSIAQAAKILGVSTKTLRRWDQRGSFVATRTAGNQRRYTQQQIDEFRSSTKNAAEVSQLFSQTEAPKEYKVSHSLQSVLSGFPSGSILRNHFLLRHKATLSLQERGKDEIKSKVNPTEHVEPPSFARPPLAKLNPFKMGVAFASLVLLFLLLILGGAGVLAKYDLVSGLPNLTAGLNSKKDQIVKFISNLPQIGFQIKNKDLLAPRSFSEVGSFVPQKDNQSSLELLSKIDNGQAVLAASTGKTDLLLNVNIPSVFNDSASFLEGLSALKIATLSGGVITDNQDVNAGTGRLTASNVLYGVLAGTGISVGLGQNPIITNTGALSVGGKAGDVSLAAGTGITVSGVTITNAGVTSLTGTSNQVIASGSTGSVTLSLPQSIGTGSIPQFGGLILSGTELPSADNLVDIGSTTLAFKNIYAYNIIGASTGIQGFWQRASGALSPTNISDDLLIGGTSTSSAKFRVTGASAFAGTTSTASISAKSSFAALVVDNSGVGDIFTASSSGLNRFVINQSGNIGIGTPSASQKLTMNGGVFYQTAAAAPSLLSSSSLGVQANSIYVVGKYAYVGTNAGASELRIFDVSNPVSPVEIGTGIDTGVSINSVVVIGKYAYIAKDETSATCSGTTLTGCEFSIYDISNPSSIIAVGGYSDDVGAQKGRTTQKVFVSGKYAFVGATTSENKEFQIFDISNPYSVVRVGAVDLSARVEGIYVQGIYAYLATTTGISIYNISNPASPTVVGTPVAFSGPVARNIYVSGKYAYIGTNDISASGSCSGSTVTTCGFRIYDISNPAAPTAVGGLETRQSAFQGVAIAGKYAYVTGFDGVFKIFVVDISIPSAPTIVSSVAPGGTGRSIFLSGKYLYYSDTTSGAEFKIYDISGIDSPAANIGTIATNSIDVSENARVGENLFINNGLTVGPGGILSMGPISLVSTGSATLNAFTITNGDGSSILNVLNRGNVGIGTLSPLATLDVRGNLTNGGTTPTASFSATSSFASLIVDNTGVGDLFTASKSGATKFVITNAGNVGIGTTLPSSFLLQVAGGIGPNTDDTYDLGSDTLRWADIYLGPSTIHIGTSTTDEGTISYDTSANILNFGTDSTANGDIAFFTDDLYLDKSNGNVGISTTTPTTFKLEVAGTIGPTAGGTYDLGSSAKRWATIYADTGNFTSIAGTVTGGSTTSPDWLINSDNATADTEDATLSFDRGATGTNVQFKWNSTTKQLSSNSPSFAILPDSSIAYSGTAALIVDQIQSQDIFTASASGVTKFVLTNSGNASASAGFTINSAGALQTTNNQTLTIGGDTTGNITLSPLNGSGRIGINTTSPLATLDVTSLLGTLPAASISAKSSFAALVVDNSGVGDIFTASASGLTRFTVQSNGNTGLGVPQGFSDTPVKLADPATLPTGIGDQASFSPDGTYLAIAHQVSPFVTIYKRSGDTFIKLADPASLPTGTGFAVSFSPDGTYLAIAHQVSPFVTIYKRSGDTFTKLADPATLPASNGKGASFSPDGTYLAIGHDNSPFVTIYKRSGDTFTKLADPATLPAGQSNATSFSPDGTYLAVTSNSSPYVLIYKRSGDTFTKLADPATLPAGGGIGASFSPDGTYLAVAHSTSPFVTIYKKSGDTFTKLADPATLPTGTGLSASFSPDGTYLAVAHSTSPFVTIYKKSGDTFTKLADPATLPTGNGVGASFSPDGTYLAIAHNVSPFVTIYKGSGNFIHKFEIAMNPPDSMPSSPSGGLSFGKEVALYRSRPFTLGLAAGNSLDIEFGALRMGGVEAINSQREAFLTSFTLAGTPGTVYAASISAQTSFAGLLVDNTGVGDLFTASKSGATKFTILNNGNLQFAGTTNFLTTLGSLATDARAINFPDAAGTICLQGSSSCGFAIGDTTNFWTSANGALYPINSTLDLLIGGTASTSANFRVTGNAAFAGTTSAASVSARSSFAGFVVDNTIGDLFTASSSGVTQFVIKNNGAVGIGTNIPLAQLDVRGDATISGNLVLAGGGRSIQSTANTTLTFGGNTTGDLDFASGGTTRLTLSSAAFTATLPWRGQDGTAAAPAFSFSGDTNTGMYRTTTDSIGLSTGGTVRLTLNTTAFTATLPWRGQDGTAGAPAFSFSGDTNTGFFRKGTDLMAAAANGQEALLFNGATGVGTMTIGNVTPTNEKLLITGAGTMDFIRVSSGNSETGDIFMLKRTGEFGIGLEAPVSALHVGGAQKGNSLVVFDQTATVSTADIFTASASGATRFVLTNNGGIGLNTGTNNSTLLSTLDIRPNLTNGGTISIASVSGNTSFAALTVDNTGVGDLFTASKSGATKFVVLNNGNLSFAGTTNFLTTLGSLATDARAINFPDEAGTLCIQSSANCGFAMGTNFWASSLGALYPGNSTLDLLIGGTASTSANFRVTGASAFAGTTSAASVSARTSFAGFVVDNYSPVGDLFTASSSGVTQFVIRNGGAVGIGTNIPLAQLDVRGDASVSGNLTLAGGARSIQTTANNTLTIGGDTTGNITLSPLNGSGTTLNTGVFNLSTGKTYQIASADVLSGTTLGTGVLTSSLTTVGALASGSIASGFGTIATANTITGTTINATTALNTGAGSGTNRIDSSGNLVNIGTITASSTITFSTFSTDKGILYTNGSGVLSQTAQGAANTLLHGNGASAPTFSKADLAADVLGILPTANGGSFWNSSNGALYPGNSTLDLLIGGTASTSANFRVTGNSAFAGTTSAASVSARTSFAGFVVDNTIGDLFTASSSGVTQFVIRNGGAVGIGTNIPLAQLDVRGDASVSGNLTLAGGARSIQTTANNTLTIGGDTTGNIIFPYNSATKIGFGTALPLAGLDIRGMGPNFGTTAIASVSGSTSFSAFLVDNTGLGDLFTASKSGLMKFVITNAGNVGIGISTPSALLTLANNGWIAGVSNDTTGVTNMFKMNSADQIQVGSALNIDGSVIFPTDGGSITAMDMPLTGSAANSYTFRLASTNIMTIAGIGDGLGGLTSGGVGIGTTSAAFKLDVQDFQSATAAAQIYNTHSGTDADGLIIKLGNNSTTAVAAANHFISFETFGIGIVGSVQGSTGKGVTYATNGIADFAEYFKKDKNQNIPFGSVVCFDNSGLAVKCDNNSNKIFGVASEAPAFLGGENLGDRSIAVGLVGQVRTRVSTANGSIKIGDPLTTSSTAGVAVKATNVGQILGKAIEPFDGAQGQEGKILVSVNITWYNPSVYVSYDGTLAGMAATVAGIGDQLALQGETLQAQIASNSASLAAQTNFVLDGDPLFADLQDKVSLLESRINILSMQAEQNASNAAFLAQIQAGQVLGASGSAGFIKDLGDVEINTATVSGNLMVLGRTTVSDLGVTGNINAGLLSINGLDPSAGGGAGGATINTLSGNLYLQNQGLGGIDILNGKVIIDAKGNLVVSGEITAKKINIDVSGAETASLGTDTLTSGQKSITINTESITDKSKVFVTATTPTGGNGLYVSEASPSAYFKVSIENSYSKDIKFNWWIVN